MVEFYIHLYNKEVFRDDDVFIKVEHQIIPRKRDYFFLNDEQKCELVKLILKNGKLERYLDYLEDVNNDEEVLKMANSKKPDYKKIAEYFSFKHAIIVHHVEFHPNGDVDVILFDGWE